MTCPEWLPKSAGSANGSPPEVSKTTFSEVPEELDAVMQQFRCGGTYQGKPCGRMLALVGIVEGTVAVKCKRCKEWNVLDVRSINVLESS